MDVHRDLRDLGPVVLRPSLLLVTALFALGSAVRLEAQGTAVARGSSNAAEEEFEVVRASALGSDDARTEELARRFLTRFPRDLLVPRVELELAKVELVRALSSPDPEQVQLRLDEAARWLERCVAHADPPTLLRARLYQGVLAHERTDEASAVAILEPIGGSLVSTEDRRLRDTTLLEACAAISRLDCALDALDALRASCRDDEECERIDERIADLGRNDEDDVATVAWVDATDPSRPSWPAIASRAIRIAESHGDWTTIHAIARRATDAGVPLDAEARAIAARAARGEIPSPRVIGVISGLSGDHSARAVSTIFAIASSAGLPPSTRIPDDAYRFAVRDHHGTPGEAARAVADLVFVARAIAIIGPADPASAAAAAARAQTIGVPFVSLAPVATSDYVFDATRLPTPPTPRAEAERRYGEGLALVVPRGARRGATEDPRIFEHAGGRLDRATTARLASARVRAVYVESSPRELRRLVRSVLPLLARGRRLQRPPLVLSRSSFERLDSGDMGREIEGAVVLDLLDPGVFGTAPDVARAAFERIRRADASTRDAVARSLRAEAMDAGSVPAAYVVQQGRLVRLP